MIKPKMDLSILLNLMLGRNLLQSDLETLKLELMSSNVEICQLLIVMANLILTFVFGTLARSLNKLNTLKTT